MLNQHPDVLSCRSLSPKGDILNNYSQVNPVCGSGVKDLSSHDTEKLFESAEGANLK